MTPRVFGPKRADHPTIGRPCSTCNVAFEAGDFTMLVGNEPSDDEQRALRDAGKYYIATAHEAHAWHLRELARVVRMMSLAFA